MKIVLRVLHSTKILPTLLFLLLSLPSMCQYRLLWKKLIVDESLDFTPENITGISPVPGGHVILFNVTDESDGAMYPAATLLGTNDTLWRGVIFQDSLWANLDLIGASRLNDSTLRLFGNDYSYVSASAPRPAPYQASLVMRDKALLIRNYFPVQLTAVEGVQAMKVTGYCGNDQSAGYLSIIKQVKGSPDLAILYPVGEAVGDNAQFAGVSRMEVPSADSSAVVAVTETWFDSARYYYQVRVLNNRLQTQVVYPDDTRSNIISRMYTKVSDRLVNLSYRPLYHVGFVTRQVRDEGGANRIAWFAFNGQKERNAALGNDNIITVNGYPIPGNEEVVTDGDLVTGGNTINRIIASVDRNKSGGDDLVLSVGDYRGIESARQVMKDWVEPEAGVVKGWADANNHLYVVANLRAAAAGGQAGLYVMKWEATQEAIDQTLDRAPATYGWGGKPFFSQQPVPAGDSHTFTLLGIDSSDANYAQNSTLKDKRVKLETPLTPVGSTYWFSGTVKVDGKRYTFTKMAVAREGD